MVVEVDSGGLTVASLYRVALPPLHLATTVEFRQNGPFFIVFLRIILSGFI